MNIWYVFEACMDPTFNGSLVIWHIDCGNTIETHNRITNFYTGLSHLDHSEESLVTIFLGLQHLLEWIACRLKQHQESPHHKTQKPSSTVVYVAVTKWPYMHDPQYICCHTCSLSWTLFGFVGWQSKARWPDSHSGWRQIGWVYTRTVSWIFPLPCIAIMIINCVYSKFAIICPPSSFSQVWF